MPPRPFLPVRAGIIHFEYGSFSPLSFLREAGEYRIGFVESTVSV